MNIRELAAKAVNPNSDMGNLVSALIVANARDGAEYLGNYTDMLYNVDNEGKKRIYEYINAGKNFCIDVTFTDPEEGPMTERFYSVDGAAIIDEIAYLYVIRADIYTIGAKTLMIGFDSGHRVSWWIDENGISKFDIAISGPVPD